MTGLAQNVHRVGAVGVSLYQIAALGAKRRLIQRSGIVRPTRSPCPPLTRGSKRLQQTRSESRAME